MTSGKRSGSKSKKTEQQTPAAGDVTEEIGTAASEAGESVQAAAGELTETFQQRITGQVTAQQKRAVDTLETVALLLQQAGEHARKEDQAGVAQVADQAAQQVERVSTAIRDREPEQLLSDTRQLAQQRPGLFLGGALAAGFLAARFLRSSAQPQTHDTAEDHSGSDQSPIDSETVPAGAYGADVTGSGSYGGDVPTAVEVPGMGTTGVTTGLDSTLLDEDATILTDLADEEVLGEDADAVSGFGGAADADLPDTERR